jgi:hypothetical protein
MDFFMRFLALCGFRATRGAPDLARQMPKDKVGKLNKRRRNLALCTKKRWQLAARDLGAVAANCLAAK